MQRLRRHPMLTALLVAIILFTVVAMSYGVFLASEAGRLPWQEDPTRIPITPFADIPGFSEPGAPAATPAASMDGAAGI